MLDMMPWTSIPDGVWSMLSVAATSVTPAASRDRRPVAFERRKGVNTARKPRGFAGIPSGRACRRPRRCRTFSSRRGSPGKDRPACD